MGIKWVWCGICAQYLTFGTYPTSTMGALRLRYSNRDLHSEFGRPVRGKVQNSIKKNE